MLLGFISLLLTVGQGLISNICISESLANTWHPCGKEHEEQITEQTEETTETTDYENRRKLLTMMASGGTFRRSLATAASTDKCAEQVYYIYSIFHLVLARSSTFRFPNKFISKKHGLASIHMVFSCK